MSVQKCETNVLGHFNFNYVQILIDEIALEGLEGIGIVSLWNRVEHRISACLTEKIKCRYWATIVNLKEITMYQLPEPLPQVQIIDRFTLVDEESGDLKDPVDYLDGPYEYCPIPDVYGSSKYYHTRKAISSELLQQVPYHQVLEAYGDTLVLVASIERRWQALASHLPIAFLQQLTPVQYCLLELIGKARENGQMTTGKTNLTNVIKEPKNLFYVRKALKDLDLVKVVYLTQCLATRGIKSILIRLNRFHQPLILSLPKIGKTHKIIEYLKSQPGYSESAEILLRNGFLTHLQMKRLKKRSNTFEFIDKIDDEPLKKKSKPSPTRKAKCMVISTKSDESSQSEDEKELTEGPVKYQYKLGVGLLRQAYERVLEAGIRGLSLGELCEMLGLEYYTCRLVFRIFKTKKIVREYSEEKGKQRESRFVAVAAGLDDARYLEEKQKFLEYINQSNTVSDAQSASTSETDMYNQNVSEEVQKIIEMGKNHITEVVATSEENKDIQSIKDSKINLTLRQLKFANGIIKIINERQCVTGFMTLSNLVAKEINGLPMVTKCLKRFLQKLVAAGQIKVYKVRWPGQGNECNVVNLICAPHIKATDYIVQSKYKEVHVRAMARMAPVKTDNEEPNLCRPLSMLINPRYMKIQKLHETIIKMAYFEKIPSHTANLGEGFLSVTDIIPEITVKFAVSNISSSGLSEISHLPILDEHLYLKLKDAPPNIAHGLIKSKSLKNALRWNLKSLAMFGLIQLIYQPENNIQTEDYVNNSLVSFLFYVNRNARIIDTTGKWPRQDEDIKSLERYYYFEEFDNVRQYWSDVFNTSVNTTIVFKGNRMKKTLNPPVRREHSVQVFDNGDRYGDGSGPCGFDSCFHMEIARLWRTFSVRQRKPAYNKTKQPARKPKPPKTKLHRKPIKKVTQKVTPTVNYKNVRKERSKLRKESTVTWTSVEDKILLLCQVAITIGSPSSQPGSLRIRNTIAKDILSIYNPTKTLTTCHRRYMMLNQSLAFMIEKDSLLNEMRRRRGLIQKYEGLIKKLRLRYSTNMSRFINVARVPMLELVWLIWQVSISDSYNRIMPCAAMDLRTFLENYNIVPATVNKIHKQYKSPDLAILRETVFLTIMLTFNREVKMDSATKIHSMLNEFSENSLRTVIEQLRQCGAISAKEKIFNNQLHKLHLENLAQSAYKVSANYQRRWISRLNSDFADSLANLIRGDLPTDHIKGSAELNCIFCELQASNTLDLRTSTKPEIVDSLGLPSDQDESLTVVEVESKQRFKSGSVTWQNNPKVEWNAKNVSSLYPIPDFDQLLQNMAENAIVTIENRKYDMSNTIINFLNEKGENGSTFEELEKITNYESIDLAQKLYKLESENVIKRVGLNNNVLILVKFINEWTIKLEDKYIIVTPWLNLDFQIMRDIFLEWTSVIVNKIFENPGCSIRFLSDSFELITCRAVQDVCMFLKNCNIITLQIVKSRQCGLYCDDDEIPEIIDFHPYESVDNILAYPVANIFTKFVYYKKVLLETFNANV